MSAIDLCWTCGGHGSLSETVTEDVPDLTPVMRRRVANGRPAVLSVPCPHCDGTDHATPLLETEAEGRQP
jgi:hypothetical protein